jgi:DNA-binding transcriptional LysR family regulator
LSRSIKALEDELGQAVFDRMGRQIELTPFGQLILSRAQGLADEAQELRLSAKKLQQGEIGNLRIGLGSGPGAMLMTPLLMFMATEHPKAHLDISRGSTTLLVQALRERQLDALVLDIRSLQPSADLKVEVLQEMKGSFMCRKTHPLARKKQVSFAALREFPIASTPLSDEVARILVERYGTEAHPEMLVNLRCE